MNSTEKQLYLIKQECERLRRENQQLKKLLNKHNIKVNNAPSEGQTKQRIKEQKLKERVEIFKSLFRGRTDVFALRWESSKTGKSGYSPACANEWHPKLCEKPTIKCSDCLNRRLLPLTDQVIYGHLSGKHTIGIYPLLQNDHCWFLAVDFDKKSWKEDASAFINTCKELTIPVSIERSRSGNGCHVWIFFSDAVPASLARKLGHTLIEQTLHNRYELGMDSFDRLFPNQDRLPQGGFGNLIALPLQHLPRKEGNSVFVDENFNPYYDQWNYLTSIKKMCKIDIEKFLNRKTEVQIVKEEKLLNTASPKKIELIINNGIIIPKYRLPSALINQLIKLATFNNPEFFKAQAKRLPTYAIPRVIDCSTETSEHIILPRGCLEEIEALLEKAAINVSIKDQTNIGTSVSTKFLGKLTTQQDEAVQKLVNSKTGILSATTGFGKTVVAASLIARRKVNTLVIVHRKQLIDQWKEKLSSFLDIDQELIGQIGGGKSKPTGAIDIATIQSLNYKGKVKNVVSNYGQVIVDECHHISAYSFEKVLKAVEAKFVHGLTATPTRKDGLQPIMKMQCGPVIYKNNAKMQAKIRPFDHLLIPRYTSFKSSTPEGQQNIQTLYRELVENKQRNQMIFNDVLTELDKGASPIVLTERLDHIHELEVMFSGFAKNILVLTGGMTAKEKEEKLAKLYNLPDEQEQLVIATGKYIGEGFDHARLDCLFLAMPIAWKGTLQQYVGRLHRLHESKTIVKVYDYVDKKEAMLMRMFEKRLKGYTSLGYKTNTNKTSNEQMKFF